MKNFEFLFWAYNAFWLILGVFIVSLMFRVKRAEREIQRLEERIANDRKMVNARLIG